MEAPVGHLFSVLAMAAAAASAAACPDPASRIQPAFGNTIVSTYPDGRQAHLWLYADGSYAGIGNRGDRNSGRWKLKGERICFRQAKPHAIPFSFCTAIPAGGVGASWSARAVTGEMLRIRLISGMPDRAA
jgi:hypothetical protein